MSQYLLWLFIVFALGNWLSVSKSLKRLEYLTKPAAILTLLAWLWSIRSFEGRLAWFAAGLVFSLAGDIFLLLPKERFIAAWLAFLSAHICYVIGFNPTIPPINLASLLLTVAVGLVALRLIRVIFAGLQSSGDSSLQIPVSIYSFVISVMLLSALITLVRADWLEGPALMVSAGALLFFLSDAVLALNRFTAPIRRSRLIIMSTYHIGQALIIAGSYLHYTYQAIPLL